MILKTNCTESLFWRRCILDFAYVALFFLNTIFSRAALPHDVLGPSSRTTPIAISEIMYKPAPRTDGKNLEFVEIYNSNPWLQDISGYSLTCADMNYTFPANTIIASNSFIVLAATVAESMTVPG